MEDVREVTTRLSANYNNSTVRALIYSPTEIDL